MARFGLVFCQLIVDGWYCQTDGSVLDLALRAWIVKQDSTLFIVAICYRFLTLVPSSTSALTGWLM
jgi:hypothetical protein